MFVNNLLIEIILDSLGRKTKNSQVLQCANRVISSEMQSQSDFYRF